MLRCAGTDTDLLLKVEKSGKELYIMLRLTSGVGVERGREGLLAAVKNNTG